MQAEAKPSLVFPAIGNGESIFSPFISITLALFQVFSLQPADPMPWDKHRGLLGLGQTPLVPWPFPIPAIPLRHGP